MAKKNGQLRWDKLDNTAHLFPVIAGESMSNVYRISVTLTERIRPNYLQQALDKVLPWFDVFRVRMRKGIFWYYFEDNKKPTPRVKEERTYPNHYIEAHKNNQYLFRVTYYEKRINLEVFHVLTDGMGAIHFLRELTYQYLRIAHPALLEQVEDRLCSDTSLNHEDSYIKNYTKSHGKEYKTKRAFCVTGEKLQSQGLGVMHTYLSIVQLKEICKKYHVSINEYLVSVFIWSIYQECLHGMPSQKPISVAVPVNLRPYYNSITTKNFFVMVSAVYEPKVENDSFTHILELVCRSLREQITKEHLEHLLSYNVANEKNIILRAFPLVFKKMAMKFVYRTSALANTSTVTNIGKIEIRKEYEPYIEGFCGLLSMSKGQNIKACVCSYKDGLVFTITSNLVDVSVQRGFVKKLAEDGIKVTIETNGVYDEKL